MYGIEKEIQNIQKENEEKEYGQQEKNGQEDKKVEVGEIENRQEKKEEDEILVEIDDKKETNLESLNIANDQEQSFDTQYIIVFGSSECGKTTLINELKNHIKMKYYYNFIDTEGLNKPKDNIAKQNLIDLIKETEDISMAILILKDAFTSDFQSNYAIYNKYLHKKKIPIICVVNGCDAFGPNINSINWLNTFQKNFGLGKMYFNKIVGTTFIKRSTFEETINKEKRNNSCERLFNAIEECSTIKLEGMSGSSIGERIKNTINYFATFFQRKN